MTIKYYNNSTQFLPDEILDNTNVVYSSISEQPTTTNENQPLSSEIEPDTSDISLSKDDVQFVDDIDDETKKFIRTIKIKTTVNNEFEQYTDQQFKNNLLLLNMDLSNNNNSINNLLYIYKNINNKIFKELDKNLYPIIDVKKKFYLYEYTTKDGDTIEDRITDNDSNLIDKQNLEDYFQIKKDINKDNNYYLKEFKLYDLERPFSYIESSDTNLTKYIPINNKDSITRCVDSNNTSSTLNDLQCVNIDNKPITLSKFRLLKNITFRNSNNENKTIYKGDEPRLAGYINKNPNKNDPIMIFNINNYMNNIIELNVNDRIKIACNFNTNTPIINGTIQSIKKNLISMEFDQVITINTKKLKTYIYNSKKLNNLFNIYPINTNNNQIYHKNLLKSNIIAFMFNNEDTNNDEKDINKYLTFILPSIDELLINNDEYINFKDIEELLKNYNYDINELKQNNLDLIKLNLLNNIKEFEKKNPKNLNLSKRKDFDSKFTPKNALFDFKSLHSSYSPYIHLKSYIDSDVNRLIYLSKLSDKGLFSILDIIKNNTNKDYDEISKIDYNKEIEYYEEELISLNENLKKLQDKDTCTKYKIEKIYYDELSFKNDEGNKRVFENKFVILFDSNNIYGHLYEMKNGNWNKLFIVNPEDKENIKICDGSYYFQKNTKSSSCIYDNINELCTNKEIIIITKKIYIIKKQLEIIYDIKDYIENFDNYNKDLENLQNYYLKLVNNELRYDQIEYKKKNLNKKYQGLTEDEDESINFENIYNNFENSNPSLYLPLLDIPEKSKLNMNDDNIKLINNILSIIGIVLNESEIKHIANSINFFNDSIIINDIQEFRKKNKDNKEFNTISNEEIIKKIYKNKFNIKFEINKFLVIISFIVIISQIQYPNVKVIKVNERFGKYFTFEGLPIKKVEVKDNDEQRRQLYVYIGYTVFNSYKFIREFEKNSNSFLSNIQKTFNLIIKARPQYKNLLNNNIKSFDQIEEINKDNIVWNGYRPQLKIDKEPKTKIGKYIFEISEVIKNSKRYKFNIFKKPYMLNFCCYEQITSDYNYYNYFKGQISLKTYITDITNNKKEFSKLQTIEKYINYYKRSGIFSNFDNDKVFEEKISFGKKDVNKVEDYTNMFSDYSNKFRDILSSNSQTALDSNINNILNNFNDLDTLSDKVSKLTEKLIEFLNNHSTKANSELYSKFKDLIVFRKLNNEIINNHDELKIKKIIQQYISYKISNIISKINNNSPNIFYKHLKDLSLKLNDNYNFDLKNKINNTNKYKIDATLLNLKNEENNLEKNTYILNYLFLNILSFLSSTLIDSDYDSEIDTINIYDKITTYYNNPNDKPENIIIISDIIHEIIRDFIENIEESLIDYVELKSKMDNLREERKNKLFNQKRSDELNDIIKKLKDVGFVINYDNNEKELENTELENTGIDITDIQGEQINPEDIFIAESEDREGNDDMVEGDEGLTFEGLND